MGVAGTLAQDVCFERDLLSYCDANGSLVTITGLRRISATVFVGEIGYDATARRTL